MIGFAYYSYALKTFLILFLLLLIHEIVHILMAFLLHYTIQEIHIYPFGYSCDIAHLNHGKSIEEILIVLAGLSTHFIFPYFFQIAYEWNIISLAYCQYLRTLNQAIFLFNCLPIYPLDGGRIFDALMHCILPYEKARKITMFFSIMSLLCWIMIQKINYNMLLMLFFLFYQQVHLFKTQLEDRLQFYSYRYHHPLSQIKNRKKKRSLYRNFPVLKIQGNSMIDEEEWLKQLFSKSK